MSFVPVVDPGLVAKLDVRLQDQVLHPDPREFTSVRWWSTEELRTAAATHVEPHLLRALDALKFDAATAP